MNCYSFLPDLQTSDLLQRNFQEIFHQDLHLERLYYREQTGRSGNFPEPPDLTGYRVLDLRSHPDPDRIQDHCFPYYYFQRILFLPDLNQSLYQSQNHSLNQNWNCLRRNCFRNHYLLRKTILNCLNYQNFLLAPLKVLELP